MDFWVQMGSKFMTVENDLKSVTSQLALLQDFIRHKFQAEFKAFVEASEAEEASGCNVFGDGGTEAAAVVTGPSGLTSQEEVYHRLKNEDSSSKVTFIAPSVSVRRVRVGPSSTSKPMSSSVSVVSSRGSVEPYYQSEENIGESLEDQAHYNTSSGQFEAEEAHEFLPTFLEPPEILDQKFLPQVVELDDDGTEGEDPLGLGNSSFSRTSEQESSGYDGYGQSESTGGIPRSRASSSTPTTGKQESFQFGRTRQRNTRKVCLKCYKSFPKPAQLRRHELTHLSVKPLKCPRCPKSFCRRDHLNGHMKTHERIDLLQSIPERINF